MKAELSCTTALLIGLTVFVLGCGETMNTGTAKKPVNNKPAADGSCPSGQSLCGIGRFAICADLQGDTHHCGVCDRSCSPGIACQAGACQQTVCTGAAVTFSGQTAPATSTYGLGIAPYDQAHQILLADINGDGSLDLVQWTYQYSDTDLSAFRVSLGQPGGGFAAPATYQASANVQEIVVTDVNSDGFADLYVLASAVDIHAVFSPYRVEVWLGHSDGHLTRSDNTGGSGPALSLGIAFADLSGDGWPDMVMATPDDPNSGNPPALSVYLSDCTGALHLSKSYTSIYGSIGRTFLWDWNADGSSDITEIGNSMLILYNRGDGTFDPPVDCAVGLGYMRELSGFADFNGDGKLDLVAADYRESAASQGSVGVMLGFGGCGFSPIRDYAIPGTGTALIRVADMNGDGILDIVAINSQFAPNSNPLAPSSVIEDNLLTVLVGNGDGTFRLQDQVMSLGPGTIADVTIGEISGDHRPDVVLSGLDGQIRTWENTCQ